MTTARQAHYLAIAALVGATLLAGCASRDGGPRVASVGTGAAAGGGAAAATDRATLLRRYGDCMRQHGVTMLDTQTAEGLPEIDKRRSPVDKVEAAIGACRAFLPTDDAAPALSQADLDARQRHAACVRSHGVADYPDPDPRTGEPTMSDSLAKRLKADPGLQPALEACQSVLPAPRSTGVVGG